MPKLIHVTTVPFSLIFVAGHMPFLRARGYEVEVISSPDPALFEFGERFGVPAHGVEMVRSVDPSRDLLALAELTRVLRRRAPDIVHAHTPKAGLLTMIAATAARVPARVYGMRGLLTLTATGPSKLVYQAAERVACQLAHRVVCEGPSLRAAALEQHLVAPSRAVVLGNGGNGVDARGRFDPAPAQASGVELRERLGYGDDDLVIGFVGRLVGDKGVNELHEAWLGLRGRFPQCRLLLVGPQEERDGLTRARLQALRDDDRVHLAGKIADTVPYYAAMDVLALPSYREGLPNVPLEAAAMGLPVVLTRVTGCVDALVDGSTGTLVAARSASELEGALAAYLSNSALRRRHGLAGRSWVLTAHDPRPVHEAHDALYRQLLARAKRSAWS